MTRVAADYFLLRDFVLGSHRSILEPMIELFGPEFLSDLDLANYQKLDGESKDEAKSLLRQMVGDMIEDFWYFTVSLARSLQQGENRLTATDAYWLGVLDEITGTSFHGMRAVVEKDPGVSS